MMTMIGMYESGSKRIASKLEELAILSGIIGGFGRSERVRTTSTRKQNNMSAKAFNKSNTKKKAAKAARKKNR